MKSNHSKPRDGRPQSEMQVTLMISNDRPRGNSVEHGLINDQVGVVLKMIMPCIFFMVNDVSAIS